LDVEIVFLVSMAGALLTGMFGGKFAFNSIYYLCASQFFAIVAAGILDLYPRLLSSRRSLSEIAIVTTLSRLLFSLLFLTALVNSIDKWRDNTRLNLQARGDHFVTPLGSDAEPGKTEMRVLLRQGEVGEAIAAILKNTRYTEERIRTGDRSILSALAAIAHDLEFEEKRRAVLWVSRDNRKFWDLPREGRRWLLPMVAVGLAEVAMIDGCPEEWEPTADGDAFGFSAYPNHAVSRDSALSLAEVKSKALSLGFQWVLELQDNGNVVKHKCL
jgi:hypothetical protein